MTCCVGLQTKSGVVMGADSAGVSGWDLIARSDLKLFHNGPYVIAFTSSFRMGQILQYELRVPEQAEPPEGEDRDDFRHMVTAFVPAARQALKDGGYVKKENEREEGGAFLVAYRGQLYQIDSDFQVGQAQSGYLAVGCGAAYALGALHALQDLNVSPREQVMLALNAAEALSAGVRGPYRILEQRR